MSKIKPVVNTIIGKGETYDILSVQRENGNLVQTYSEKATSTNKQKEKRKKHVWPSGRLHIVERLNERPRLQ